MAFLETFGFVTYASMGAWHAAVTKGLILSLLGASTVHCCSKASQRPTTLCERKYFVLPLAHLNLCCLGKCPIVPLAFKSCTNTCLYPTFDGYLDQCIW